MEGPGPALLQHFAREARGTLGPNILIDPHRACRQAHGRVRRALLLLMVVVQIILQLIQWRGTLLTSLRHSGPMDLWNSRNHPVHRKAYFP